MARKVVNYTVTDKGRDNGKKFVLTEMTAAQAEAWAFRAILALMAGNVDIPENFQEMGMAGLAEMGLRALSGLRWEVAEPLLNEMFGCVQFMPDPSKTHVVRPLVESDIEEVKTRIALRMEVWKLHTDFLQAAGSSLVQAAAAAAPKPARVTGTSRRS